MLKLLERALWSNQTMVDRRGQSQLLTQIAWIFDSAQWPDRCALSIRAQSIMSLADGDWREAIFRTDADRTLLLYLLGQTCRLINGYDARSRLPRFCLTYSFYGILGKDVVPRNRS